MGIIVSSVLGIFNLAISSLRVSSTVTDQFIATNLAAEGLEVTKNILDNNVTVGDKSWNAGFSDPRCFEVQYNTLSEEIYNLSKPECDSAEETFNDKNARFLRANTLTTGLYDYDDQGETTIFKRWVQTTPVSGSDLKIRAIATVAWKDRKNPDRLQTSQIATDFIGWRSEK